MLRQDPHLHKKQGFLERLWSETKDARCIAGVDSPIERAKCSDTAADATHNYRETWLNMRRKKLDVAGVQEQELVCCSQVKPTTREATQQAEGDGKPSVYRWPPIS